MRVIYIGQFQEGATSRMRGLLLQSILQPSDFVAIDINVPIQSSSRIAQSLGWRYCKGPMIKAINKYIRKNLNEVGTNDLVWVDKGVFLDPDVLKELKSGQVKVVHYTPDAAFMYNKSSLFYKGLSYYDHCITTKSFEIRSYADAGAKDVYFCTQGYDPQVHKSTHSFSEKQCIGFFGLAEEYRFDLISKLVGANIPVVVGGKGWEKFSIKHSAKANFEYLGNNLYGDVYAAAISKCQMALGLLSKNFPELHTTRTFEIPACGTALLTERNDEIASFYDDSQVIYFDDADHLIKRIQYFLANPELLQEVTRRGYERVRTGGFDYGSIIRGIIKHIGL